MGLDLDAEIRQNTRDISNLAVTVQRVVTMVENSEKNHTNEQLVTQEIFSQIKQINEKVSATISLKDDVINLRDDIKVARHDVGALQNAIHGLGLLNEKVLELKSDTNEKYLDLKDQISKERVRVDAIISRNTSIDGGIKAISTGAKWFWAIFGGIIISIVGAIGFSILSGYFQQANTLTQSYQSKQVISGE